MKSDLRSLDKISLILEICGILTQEISDNSEEENYRGEASAMEELHPIPALNPDSLQKICLEYTLLWIKRLRKWECFELLNAK